MKNKLIASIVIAVFLIQAFAIAIASAAPTSPVEKEVFVHYSSNAKSRPAPQETGTYKLMGPKWNTLPVPFAVNTANSGLDPAAAASTILLSANEWDDGFYSSSEGLTWAGTSANLFVNYASDSVPQTTITSTSYDGVNAIFWGDLGTTGTIAVTTVYYNRFTRQILEFDMEFNTQYQWSVDATAVSGKMDLQNIATHELGHSVGLADLYRTSTSQETMFGYSNYGDISKRDLYLGDQAGITKLYG